MFEAMCIEKKEMYMTAFQAWFSAESKNSLKASWGQVCYPRWSVYGCADLVLDVSWVPVYLLLPPVDRIDMEKEAICLIGLPWLFL